MKKFSAAVLLLMMISSVGAHTGDNHSNQELETEEHQRGEEFQFVSGDYPLNTKEIVLVEVFLVALLFAVSVNHYIKKGKSEED